MLDKAGLIKNSIFCNIFAKFMGFSDDNYLSGIYYFTDDMGVEKMLTRFKTSSTRGTVISITIPEGYTVDQIFQRLERTISVQLNRFTEFLILLISVMNMTLLQSLRILMKDTVSLKATFSLLPTNLNRVQSLQQLSESSLMLSRSVGQKNMLQKQLSLV